MRFLVIIATIAFTQTLLGEDTKRLQQEARALRNRAIAVADAGKTTAAINLLTESLEKQEDPLTYVARAAMWFKLEKYELCMNDGKRALEIDAKCAVAYEYLAYCKFDSGDLDAALADIDHAIALDQSDSSGPGLKMIILLEKENLSEALVQADRLVAIEPEPFSFIMRGGIRLKVGDERGAKADFEHVLTIDKDNADAMLCLARLTLNDSKSKSPDHSSAIKLLEQSCQLQTGKEDEWEHLSTLAALHAKQSSFEKAVELQERVMELAPQDKLADEGKDLAAYKKQLAQKTAADSESK